MLSVWQRIRSARQDLHEAQSAFLGLCPQLRLVSAAGLLRNDRLNEFQGNPISVRGLLHGTQNRRVVTP